MLEMKAPGSEMKAPWKAGNRSWEDKLLGLNDKVEELVCSFKDNDGRLLKREGKRHDLWDTR